MNFVRKSSLNVIAMLAVVLSFSASSFAKTASMTTVLTPSSFRLVS